MEISDKPQANGEARGRGALDNAVGRFEPYARVRVDDGWPVDEPAPVLRTQVAQERPRSAITRNSSPDLSFDRSVNVYRGCEHGCVYCFARPGHAWLGLSPGLDFETRLVARPGIAAVLERELRRRAYRPATIAIGTYTDPYQPIEATHALMREVLEVLRRFRHPVGIVTKGSLIERDIDLLSDMAAQGLCAVGVSVTTLDRAVSRAMEPRVPTPARRLQVIERLAGAGVPVRICASPLVPGLTDHELEAILEAGAQAGAVSASMIPLRLPREVAGLFRNWIEDRFPDSAGKVMRRVRDLHGGQDYDAEFGRRMTGQGTWATLYRSRFRAACARLGLAREMPALRSDLFEVPLDTPQQPSLF
ncbi:MAG: PA0069 family radical SAM protein [Alphaproteobacteria bacterium]|jgi:DNA repair photolyase|nr:PA0069 family radical SAM protein [Alphaproteobacteria bacterium]